MASPLSVRNSKVIAARKLRRRRAREQTGEFLAEGPQAVGAACAAGAALEVFFSDPAHWQRLGRPEISGHLVESEVIDSLSESLTPQGIVARCRWVPGGSEIFHRPLRLGIVAHEVREPGNAGAIIRVADAVGADFLALSENSVDPTNAKTVRASAGSLFHVPIVTGLATLPSLAGWRAAGVRTLAADVTTDSVDLFTLQGLQRPTVWLFGNEAHGLAPELLAACDEVVRIPIFGQAESLNLATAAAVCLYASARAQHAAAPAGSGARA